MKSEFKQAKGEKPYERPQLTTISLRPEEAVLGACKVLGRSGTHDLCGLTCPNAGS
ncbi:MAG TPA: hypothetical protein VMP68_25325 [Candidatus Eisenbacteria bacterium]|nr:hypothetical protein [Candidatus Eisenbacteria bacterium]